MKKQERFMHKCVTDEYPIEKFKKLIEISIDIAEAFIMTLEDGFDYDSSSIASYGEKYGSSQHSTVSKIESILISQMLRKEQMENFLNSYFGAYNYLNSEEKKIFNATFIDRMTDVKIIIEYDTYSDYIQLVRNSAIVKFCLRSGLNKFIDLV